MDTMDLWTRQVPHVWDILQEEGIYAVKEAYIRQKNESIADYYLQLYSWFSNTARKYIPVPARLQYQIWLCINDETMLQPVENTIILKLKAPKDKVLIVNMAAWGYVVNYWYVPLDDADAAAHQKELQRYGIHSEDALVSTSLGNFYPLLKRKIVNSWERVFTLTPVNEQDAVAVMWEIQREWVEEVRHYGRD